MADQPNCFWRVLYWDKEFDLHQTVFASKKEAHDFYKTLPVGCAGHPETISVFDCIKE